MGEKNYDKESLRRERNKAPGFLKKLKKKIKNLRNRDANIYPLWSRLHYLKREEPVSVFYRY